MAMPIGAIAGSLAATCGHHNHNELRDELNAKYYEDLEKLKEKRKLILDYLKKHLKLIKSQFMKILILMVQSIN